MQADLPVSLKLTSVLGERFLAQLGSSYIPISQRDQPKPSHQGTRLGAAIHCRSREGVVGKEEGGHLVGLYEGAGTGVWTGACALAEEDS